MLFFLLFNVPYLQLKLLQDGGLLRQRHRPKRVAMRAIPVIYVGVELRPYVLAFGRSNQLSYIGYRGICY